MRFHTQSEGAGLKLKIFMVDSGHMIRFYIWTMVSTFNFFSFNIKLIWRLTQAPLKASEDCEKREQEIVLN